jgi:calcium binding protein 39
MMMNLLRDTSANIQFEAFHVFKVFVANPKKPEAICQILINNRDKLIAYLRNFQNSKGVYGLRVCFARRATVSNRVVWCVGGTSEDPQFVEEKALLIRTLEGLKVSDAADAATPAPTSE